MLSTVPHIDFLPADYRQARQLRQKRVWHRGIVIALAVLMTLGVFGQRQQRASLIARRDLLRSQVLHMSAQLASPEQYRQRIQQLDARADLIGHLKVRPAATRVLAAIAGALPPSVTLTDVRWGYESSGLRPHEDSDDPRGRKARRNEAKTLPEKTDLATILAERQQKDLFVSLDGIAPDDVSVTRLLQDLQATRLFAEVRLQYTDHHRHGEHDLRLFSVRLRVRDPFVTEPKPAERFAESEFGARR